MNRVRRVNKGIWAREVFKVMLVTQDHEDSLVRPVHKDFKVFKVYPVRKVKRATLEIEDLLARLDHRVNREFKGNVVRKVKLVMPEPLEHRVSKVVKDRQDSNLICVNSIICDA